MDVDVHARWASKFIKLSDELDDEFGWWGPTTSRVNLCWPNARTNRRPHGHWTTRYAAFALRCTAGCMHSARRMHTIACGELLLARNLRVVSIRIRSVNSPIIGNSGVNSGVDARRSDKHAVLARSRPTFLFSDMSADNTSIKLRHLLVAPFTSRHRWRGIRGRI